jgi:hypothetical protein
VWLILCVGSAFSTKEIGLGVICSSQSADYEELCLLGYATLQESQLHAVFLLTLLFNPEDGGDMFTRNMVVFHRTT